MAKIISDIYYLYAFGRRYIFINIQTSNFYIILFFLENEKRKRKKKNKKNKKKKKKAAEHEGRNPKLYKKTCMLIEFLDAVVQWWKVS